MSLNRPKVWIVSELFYPDQISTAHVMTEIARRLAIKQQVGVICGPPGYEQTYSMDAGELDGNILIHRVSIPSINKNKLVSRLFRLLLLSIKMFFAVLLKIKSGDRLIIVTNPAFLLLMVALLKKLKGYHLNVIVHDVFPENLIPAKIIQSDSFSFRMLSKLYNAAYRRSDRLIVVGRDMKELMIHKLGIEYSEKIEIITNWSDEYISPVPSFDRSAYWGADLDDKVVITFAGNLGRLQGLPAFLDCLNKADNQQIVFILIGGGALHDELKNYVQTKQMSNVLFWGSRPRTDQQSYLNGSDICLVSLANGMYGLGVPSKTYNILASGKPILYIGDKGSEVDQYVEEHGCGWSFDWNEKGQLIDFLRSVDQSKTHKYAEIGSNSRNICTEFYTKNKVLPLFDQLVQ